MRKKFLLFLIFTSIIFLIVACGSNNDLTTEDDAINDEAETEQLAYEPEEVTDTDVCEVCAMAVPNNEHATQIVLTNERSLKFDDIGCLHAWIDENGEDDIGIAFVRDFDTEEWIDINSATFVYDEEIETPMAYGVISFKEAEEAEAFIDEFGKGTLMTRDDLNTHKWTMNKEMMNHDNHDDHDETDDE